MLTRHGTEGRVYGGDCNLVHVDDGERANFGHWLSIQLEREVRRAADVDWTKPLCPGCYMTIIYNTATQLARDNGQSMAELGWTLAVAFTKLARGEAPERIEEIEVQS